MKMLRYRFACCAFLVLAFIWSISHGILDLAQATPSTGCYSNVTWPDQFTPKDYTAKGSSESPQRCYADTDCRQVAECTQDPNTNKFPKYLSWEYVGDCEAAPCPDTARCLLCEGFLMCAIYNSYANQADCQTQTNPVGSGAFGFFDKCDGSTGT